MPLYEYKCSACSHLDEVLQKMSDPAPEACSQCGKGPMVKQMSMTSFALKGTGWYVTDFKGGSSPKKSTDESSPASDVKTRDGAAVESKSSESKSSESTTDAKAEVAKPLETPTSKAEAKPVIS
jgi:putative FmdB family regulatory protein